MKRIILIFLLFIILISGNSKTTKTLVLANSKQTLNLKTEITSETLDQLILKEYIEKSIETFDGDPKKFLIFLSDTLANFSFKTNTLIYFIKTFSENKFVIKIMLNNKKYSVLINFNTLNQKYSLKKISGPFMTAKTWIEQYDLPFYEIPIEDSAGDLKAKLSSQTAYPTADSSAEIADVQGKVFGICLPNSTFLDTHILRHLKSLSNSGAIIHIVYPIQTNFFKKETVIKIGSGQFVLHPVPRQFYFDNVKLIFDYLDNLDGIIDSEIACPENNLSKVYSEIRGVEYDSFPKSPRTPAQPITHKTRVYQYFKNFFYNLNATLLQKQIQQLPTRPIFKNIHITIFTSEFWFIGGVETYLALEIAYLLTQENITINIVFLDSTLADEYLPPIYFGKGTINFYPVETEKLRLKYKDPILAEAKIKKVLDSLIPKTDIAICQHILTLEGPIFLNYMSKKGIPSFGMYHGGGQLLSGRLTEQNKSYVASVQNIVAQQSKFVIGTVSDISELTAKSIGRNAGIKNRIFYCGPMINFELFNRKNLDYEKIKELKYKYNITNECPVLILPHRMYADKGILESIIAAYQAFSELKMDFRIFIIGEAPAAAYKIELKSYIQKQGLQNKVFIINGLPQEELLYFYAISNLGMILTKAEGKPLTTIEGRAMGLPWIASDIDGVADDPDSMFAVTILDKEKKYLSVQAITENCKKLLLKIFSNPTWQTYLQEAGLKGKIFIKKYYSPAAVIANHEDVIEGLLLEKKLKYLLIYNENINQLLKNILSKNELDSKITDIIVTFSNKGSHKYMYIITVENQEGKKINLALKLLKQPTDDNILTFFEEFKKTNKLKDTEYVPKLYNFFNISDENLVYVFTIGEYIDGENLGEKLAEELELGNPETVNKILSQYLYTLGKIFAANMKLDSDAMLYSECLVDPDYSNFIITPDGKAVLVDLGDTNNMSLFDYFYIIKKRIEIRNRINRIYKGSLDYFNVDVWKYFFMGIFGEKELKNPSLQTLEILKNFYSQLLRSNDSLLKNYLKNLLKPYLKKRVKISLIPNFIAPARLYYGILSRIEILEMTIQFVTSEYSNAFIHDKVLYLPIQWIQMMSFQMAELSAREFNLLLDKFLLNLRDMKFEISDEINLKKFENFKQAV